MSINFIAVDRVAWDEDRLREARFWASRSIAERVIAGWALAENNLIQSDEHESEKRAGFTLRRVAGSRR